MICKHIPLLLLFMLALLMMSFISNGRIPAAAASCCSRINDNCRSARSRRRRKPGVTPALSCGPFGTPNTSFISPEFAELELSSSSVWLWMGELWYVDIDWTDTATCGALPPVLWRRDFLRSNGSVPSALIDRHLRVFRTELSGKRIPSDSPSSNLPQNERNNNNNQWMKWNARFPVKMMTLTLILLHRVGADRAGRDRCPIVTCSAGWHLRCLVVLRNRFRHKNCLDRSDPKAFCLSMMLHKWAIPYQHSRSLSIICNNEKSHMH